MDQLRKAFGWLKQQHFWVLSVLVPLILLVCWWSAAKTMSQQYKDGEGKITSEFNNLKTVRSAPFHANDDINKRQVEETNKLAAQVAELWQKLYDAQRAQVLIWPPALNAAFRDVVEQLEFGQTIPSKHREHYQNYILRHFPDLAKKIGAQPIPEGAAGAMGGGGSFSRMGRPEQAVGTPPGGQMEEDDDVICIWDPANQAEVRTDLVFQQQPSSIRIWVTQENLWVYHALLDVIKNTNDAAGATRMSNAAVRHVIMLEVGQRAAMSSRTPNRIYMPATAAPAGEAAAPGELPAVPSPEATGEMPGRPEGFGGEGSGPETEAQEAERLLRGRYLGDDGLPSTAAVASADTGASTESGAPASGIDRSAYGKEYVRLPVRMVLEMDQRYLPHLISECAIRPLQIEVKEVRINPSGGIGGEGGGMPGGMRGGLGGVGERGGGGGTGGGSFPELTGLQEFKSQPQIATVIIQGVIYIFNKPNQEILKPTTEGEPPLALTQ